MTIPWLFKAGTGAATTSGTTLTVPVPTGPTPTRRDIQLLAVVNSSSTGTPTIDVPNGWHSIAYDQQTSLAFRAFYRLGVGYGDQAVTVSSVTSEAAGRMFTFFYSNPPGGANSANKASGLTLGDQSVTTPHSECLAINFACNRSAANPIGVFGGGGLSGGTWVLFDNYVGSASSLGLQTALMPAAGTINGGAGSDDSNGRAAVIGCYLPVWSGYEPKALVLP